MASKLCQKKKNVCFCFVFVCVCVCVKNLKISCGLGRTILFKFHQHAIQILVRMK